jgi:hypothetical protein
VPVGSPLPAASPSGGLWAAAAAPPTRRIVLGYLDGSSYDLDPDSRDGRALAAVARVIRTAQ